MRSTTFPVDLLAFDNPPEVVAARTAAIRQAVLRDSTGLRQPNFERIDLGDLARLFELYDRAFFAGELGAAVKEQSGQPLGFGLSSRMTAAGGKTIMHRMPRPGGPFQVAYEIVIASRLLFMTFGGEGRPVAVCGSVCQDRLEALQRIMEHEIVHLAEMIVHGRSSCSGPRFRFLAARIFGHGGTRHDLVTPGEHAAVNHGITLGGTVGFEFEGRSLVGRVNRIHRRATVLVEDAAGTPYTDGKRYQKFYVPLEKLTASP